MRRSPVTIGIAVVVAFLACLALFHKAQGWLFDHAMMTSELQPISARQMAAARDWFNRHGYSIAKLSSMPVEERAKRLTFLTYRFCTPGNMGGPNLSRLYQKCETTCGGYAYVYRGLAKVVGIETRFADFYTIPLQGNHTAIEVSLPDKKWGFVDPTFGVVFTTNGRPEGRLMSLAEVTSLPARALSHHVVQATKSARTSYSAPLLQQFGAAYRHSGMPISNYSSSEAISHDMPQELVVLVIPLNASRNIVEVGNFKSSDPATLHSDWVKFALSTIHASDLRDSVSPDASDLYNDREDRMSVLRISNIRPGHVYRLELRVVNPAKYEQSIQLSAIGRDASLLNDGIKAVAPGVSTIRLDFVAVRSSAEIYAHNLAAKGMLQVVGIRLSATQRENDVSLTK